MSLFRTRFKGRALREIPAYESLRDSRQKQSYVTFLFDLIAPGYDLFTRWFSFGMDRRWKRDLVVSASRGLAARSVVADLACGSGDIASSIAEYCPAGFVVGVDVSAEMLRVANRPRPQSKPVTYLLGDILNLPFCSHRVDVVTIGYGLRNLPVLEHGLQEIARVLRPGGQLVVLDFFKPRSRAWRIVYLGYLRVAGAMAGWVWHGDPATYSYIARSIERFVALDEFLKLLALAGFTPRRVERRLGGGIGIITATRDTVAP